MAFFVEGAPPPFIIDNEKEDDRHKVRWDVCRKVGSNRAKKIKSTYYEVNFDPFAKPERALDSENTGINLTLSTLFTFLSPT